MKNKVKILLLAVAMILTVVFITSCGKDDHYSLYDDEGYQISVKYDANGGTFTTGTTVIVDTYSLNSLPTKNGKRVAQLITPDDEVRGIGNKFKPSLQGQIFVGWYAERTEVKDAKGNVSYKYGGKWDFKKDRLMLDPDKEYTASEPVLTLYAAWMPIFKYEFYSIKTGELLGERKIDPTTGDELLLPKWDEEDGTVTMYYFPKVKGETFNGVYLDPEKKVEVTGESIAHTGSFNEKDATSVNPVMKLYIDTLEGDWYHIKSAQAFNDIVSDAEAKAEKNGTVANYIIECDLDFKYKNLVGKDAYYKWPEKFSKNGLKGQLVGKLKADGSCVTIKNVNYKQPTTGITNVGLFAKVSETAILKSINFESITMQMTTGAPMQYNACFGLLAGTLSDGSKLENVKITGTIEISDKVKFKEQAGIIGLVCGLGDLQGIDYSGITCVATGKNADSLDIQYNGNQVIIVGVNSK